MSIRYSDGRDVEVQILETIEEARRQGKPLTSSSSVAPETYSEWAFRYHLSSERAQLVKHLNFNGLSVLEIGAGMGAVSRFLAEEASSLFVVEGTEQRFRSLQARLKDLENWSGTVVNFQDFESTQKFDVVCVVGVMEYSELYFKLNPSDRRTPFEAFLDKALSFLQDGGVLVLAIENKLGIKYWGGAAEDHSGKIFDGICGYPSQPSAKTLSRKELKELFASRGLSQIDEHYPFPDYKVPSTVISLDLVEQNPGLARELALTRPFENYGNPRCYAYADDLALQSVADAGLLADFANSFLFVASKEAGSPVRTRVLSRSLVQSEVGWHYSGQRAEPAVTRFTVEGGTSISPVIRVEKVAKSGAKERLLRSDRLAVCWTALSKEAVREGEKLSGLLLRDLYFEKWDSFFERMVSFLSWSFTTWQDAEGASKLQGGALDAVFTNCIVGTQGVFQLFDLEWRAESSIPKDWFVLRNVLVLGKFWAFFQPTRGFESFKELYLQLCDRLGVVADYERATELEGEFQALSSGQGTSSSHLESVKQHFETPILVPNFLREPRVEVGLKGERHHLHTLIENLHTESREVHARLGQVLADNHAVHSRLAGVLAENHDVHTKLGAVLADNQDAHTRLGAALGRVHHLELQVLQNEFLLNSLPHRLAERGNRLLNRFKGVQKFVKLVLKPFS